MENLQNLPFLDYSPAWTIHHVTLGQSYSSLSLEFPMSTLGVWLGGPALLLSQVPQKQLNQC